MLRKLVVGYLFLVLVAMGCKALALSQPPTPTPTKTPKPTFTPTGAVTPTAIVMATDTPLPTDTPTTTPTDTPAPVPPTDTPVPTDTPAPTNTPAPPPPTNTPEPTAPPAPTPTPIPDKDFKVIKRQLMCGRGGHTIFITVVDISGAPLNGVVLKVTDPDPNTEDVEITTGDKGPGKAEYLMWGEQWVWVERDASGRTYGKDRSEIAEHVDRVPPAWDLRAAGECEGLTDEECEQKRYTCDGSYDLVFQRQW